MHCNLLLSQVCANIDCRLLFGLNRKRPSWPMSLPHKGSRTDLLDFKLFRHRFITYRLCIQWIYLDRQLIVIRISRSIILFLLPDFSFVDGSSMHHCLCVHSWMGCCYHFNWLFCQLGTSDFLRSQFIALQTVGRFVQAWSVAWFIQTGFFAIRGRTAWSRDWNFINLGLGVSIYISWETLMFEVVDFVFTERTQAKGLLSDLFLFEIGRQAGPLLAVWAQIRTPEICVFRSFCS